MTKLHDIAYGGRWYSLSEHGPSYMVSDHFALIEIASKDGADAVLVGDGLVDLLEAVRAEYGPWTPNSAYRSLSHHVSVYKRIGLPVKWQSAHLVGAAVDAAPFEAKPRDLARWAVGRKVGGIGLYRTFVHLDTGPVRSWTGSGVSMPSWLRR